MSYRSNEAAEKSERFVVSTSAGVQKHKPVSQSKRPPRRKLRRDRDAAASAIPATLRVLRQEPPEEVRALLAEQLIQSADLLICTDTDISRAGEYAPQWLAITADRLLVCSDPPSAAAKIIIDLQLSQATDFRCESAVGSGLLQARVDGMYLDLLRYSNTRSDRFAKIARKLERRLKGEPIVIEAEEEIDTRRCKGCGMMLDFAGEVCPRCVNKGAVLARMWKLMLPYKWAASTMMGLLVVGICLDLVGPRLTQYLIDHVLGAATKTPASARLLMLAHIVLILAARAGLADGREHHQWATQHQGRHGHHLRHARPTREPSPATLRRVLRSPAGRLARGPRGV